VGRRGEKHRPRGHLPHLSPPLALPSYWSHPRPEGLCPDPTGSWGVGSGACSAAVRTAVRSGGSPQGSSVGTTTGRGHAHLKGGRPAQNRPQAGTAKAVKDGKARKAPSVFRSGARVREAQNRRGGRSNERHHRTTRLGTRRAPASPSPLTHKRRGGPQGPTWIRGSRGRPNGPTGIRGFRRGPKDPAGIGNGPVEGANPTPRSGSRSWERRSASNAVGHQER
jgi:hypothetical protein